MGLLFVQSSSCALSLNEFAVAPEGRLVIFHKLISKIIEGGAFVAGY